MTSTLLAHLTCLCGAISAPGSLLSESELPASAEVCHCNPCRRTTGSLGVPFPTLHSAPSPDVLAKLTGYDSSHICTRFFCSKCGCHCFIQNHQDKIWYVSGGIIEPISSTTTWPKDTIKLSQHSFVADTIDGGLTPLLLNLNGRSIPTWTTVPEPSKPFDISPADILTLPRKSMSNLSPPAKDSYLPAKCYCGGVSLLIKRADFTPDTPTRYIPSDPTKYLTYLCACRSCRLSTGVSLTAWALILPGNVFNANAGDNLEPVVFGEAACQPDANPGLTLKHNWSSHDTCRSFCGQCGATVFYWCSQRPDELDVSVGIMRSEEGILARRWLDWEWGRCSFPEEAIDEEICTAWLGCAELMKRIES